MNNCKVVNFEKEIKRANFKRKIKSKNQRCERICYKK